MDFSTNHYSVVFYAVWFLLGYLFKERFVFAEEVYAIVIMVSLANIVVFRGIPVRSDTTYGTLLSGLCGGMLSFSIFGMYAFDTVPVLSMLVVCFTVGLYFALDSDFYYGEDLPMKYMYGLYLLFAVKEGTSFVWGLLCSTVVVLVGWIAGQRADGCPVTIRDMLFEDYGDFATGLFLSAVDSIPLYSYLAYGLVFAGFGVTLPTARDEVLKGFYYLAMVVIIIWFITRFRIAKE